MALNHPKWPRIQQLASMILDDARAINRIIYADDPRDESLPHVNVPQMLTKVQELQDILATMREVKTYASNDIRLKGRNDGT